jgi:hypothetical protein
MPLSNMVMFYPQPGPWHWDDTVNPSPHSFFKMDISEMYWMSFPSWKKVHCFNWNFHPRSISPGSKDYLGFVETQNLLKVTKYVSTRTLPYRWLNMFEVTGAFLMLQCSNFAGHRRKPRHWGGMSAHELCPIGGIDRLVSLSTHFIAFGV